MESLNGEIKWRMNNFNEIKWRLSGKIKIQGYLMYYFYMDKHYCAIFGNVANKYIFYFLMKNAFGYFKAFYFKFLIIDCMVILY